MMIFSGESSCRSLGESKDNPQNALEKILAAAYATTGPGNYLREKKDIIFGLG
jgi:hypothetical protein